MRLSKTHYNFGDGNTLRINDNRLDFFADGWQLFSFPIESRLPSEDMPDTDTELHLISEKVESGLTAITWQAVNASWKSKKYHLNIFSDHVTYQVEVNGTAVPDKIEYFRGGATTKSARYFVSSYLYCQSFDADHERSVFFVGTDRFLKPELCSPPPFVFPFHNDANTKVIGVGIAAAKEQNNYERFGVRFIKPNTMWFELGLYGYTAIDGCWTSPTIWFGFADRDLETVSKYSSWCRDNFCYPEKVYSQHTPSWWKKPIYCGWLEQFLLTGMKGGHESLSTQANYEAMLARMDRVGLRPGTVIIDDKWQSDYGTMEPDPVKWPDMRGFVDEQHKKGRHVLLWWRLWSPDGLTSSECLVQYGSICAADPTSPAYRRRIEKIVYSMLSQDKGCMNCDGFKLDYIYRYPDPSRRIKANKPNEFGLELLHDYYKLIYDAAKEIKHDALINTSVAHPYFADVFDQIRLHDYNSGQRCTVAIMKHRAALIQSVFPQAIIDTDGANAETGNSQFLLYHNKAAIDLGVPALYAISCLSDDEMKQIQNDWDRYEMRLNLNESPK